MIRYLAAKQAIGVGRIESADCVNAPIRKASLLRRARGRLPSGSALLYYASFASIPLLGLLQTRLLTRLLAPAELGTIQLVVPVLGILGALGGLGTHNFALRFYRRDGMRVVKEGLLLSIATSIVLLTLLALVLSRSSTLFGITMTPVLLLVLLAAVLVKQVFGSVKVQLRSIGRHGLYNVTVVAERAVWVAGAVVGVIAFMSSPPAGFIGGGAAFSLLLLGLLAPAWVPSLTSAQSEISRHRVKEMLSYGAPVMAVLMASDLLVSGSRYVIVAGGLGPDDVARYAVGYSLAILGMKAAYEPLITYAHPRIFETWEAGGDSQAMLRRFFNLYLLTGVGVGVVMWLAEDLLLKLVADSSYRLPTGMFPCLLLACFLTGIYRFLSTRLFLKTNTSELLLCFIAALVVNLGAGMVLIRSLGLYAIAIAAVAGSAVLCLLVWWRGRTTRIVSRDPDGMTAV